MLWSTLGGPVESALDPRRALLDGRQCRSRPPARPSQHRRRDHRADQRHVDPPGPAWFPMPTSSTIVIARARALHACRIVTPSSSSALSEPVPLADRAIVHRRGHLGPPHLRSGSFGSTRGRSANRARHFRPSGCHIRSMPTASAPSSRRARSHRPPPASSTRRHPARFTPDSARAGAAGPSGPSSAGSTSIPEALTRAPLSQRAPSVTTKRRSTSRPRLSTSAPNPIVRIDALAIRARELRFRDRPVTGPIRDVEDAITLQRVIPADLMHPADDRILDLHDLRADIEQYGLNEAARAIELMGQIYTQIIERGGNMDQVQRYRMSRIARHGWSGDFRPALAATDELASGPVPGSTWTLQAVAPVILAQTWRGPDCPGRRAGRALSSSRFGIRCLAASRGCRDPPLHIPAPRRLRPPRRGSAARGRSPIARRSDTVGLRADLRRRGAACFRPRAAGTKPTRSSASPTSCSRYAIRAASRPGLSRARRSAR